MISTRDLSGLPDIDTLKRLMQSMAMLDALMCPRSGSYYSFITNWSASKQVGMMDNGSGDEFFAIYNEHGCFLKGFAHEYEMSPYRVNPPAMWPGLLDGIPPEFASCLK